MTRPTRRATWQVALVLAVLAVVAMGSGAPAPAQPGAELSVAADPGSVVAGGWLGYSGRCWRGPADGSTDHVHLTATQQRSDDVPPLRFEVLPDPPVAPADGSYRGRVQVPGDAPAGTYDLQATCGTQDWVIPGGGTTFEVRVPATTSTTSHPVTTAPAAPAAPAAARPGSAAYTG